MRTPEHYSTIKKIPAFRKSGYGRMVLQGFLFISPSSMSRRAINSGCPAPGTDRLLLFLQSLPVDAHGMFSDAGLRGMGQMPPLTLQVSQSRHEPLMMRAQRVAGINAIRSSSSIIGANVPGALKWSSRIGLPAPSYPPGLPNRAVHVDRADTRVAFAGR